MHICVLQVKVLLLLDINTLYIRLNNRFSSDRSITAIANCNCYFRQSNFIFVNDASFGVTPCPHLVYCSCKFIACTRCVHVVFGIRVERALLRTCCSNSITGLSTHVHQSWRSGNLLTLSLSFPCRGTEFLSIKLPLSELIGFMLAVVGFMSIMDILFRPSGLVKIFKASRLTLKV